MAFVGICFIEFLLLRNANCDCLNVRLIVIVRVFVCELPSIFFMIVCLCICKITCSFDHDFMLVQVSFLYVTRLSCVTMAVSSEQFCFQDGSSI
jgi:hypothetical protein